MFNPSVCNNGMARKNKLEMSEPISLECELENNFSDFFSPHLGGQIGSLGWDWIVPFSMWKARASWPW